MDKTNKNLFKLCLLASAFSWVLQQPDAEHFRWVQFLSPFNVASLGLAVTATAVAGLKVRTNGKENQ